MFGRKKRKKQRVEEIPDDAAEISATTGARWLDDLRDALADGDDFDAESMATGRTPPPGADAEAVVTPTGVNGMHETMPSRGAGETPAAGGFADLFREALDAAEEDAPAGTELADEVAETGPEVAVDSVADVEPSPGQGERPAAITGVSDASPRTWDDDLDTPTAPLADATTPADLPDRPAPPTVTVDHDAADLAPDVIADEGGAAAEAPDARDDTGLDSALPETDDVVDVDAADEFDELLADADVFEGDDSLDGGLLDAPVAEGDNVATVSDLGDEGLTPAPAVAPALDDLPPPPPPPAFADVTPAGPVDGAADEVDALESNSEAEPAPRDVAPADRDRLDVDPIAVPARDLGGSADASSDAWMTAASHDVAVPDAPAATDVHLDADPEEVSGWPTSSETADDPDDPADPPGRAGDDVNGVRNLLTTGERLGFDPELVVFDRSAN